MKKIILLIFFHYLACVIGSNNVFANYQCDNVWRYTVPGADIGRKSLHTIDIDNDGTEEIVSAARAYGGQGYWYVLKFDSATNDYTIVWASELFQKQVTTLDVVDMYNNGGKQIAVGLDNGSMLIYNAFTKNILAKFSVPNQTITHIEYGDVDNDGTGNLVASTKDTIYVYDKNTFSLTRKIPHGGQYFKIGNVDADSTLELITSTGKVLEVTGATITVQWYFNSIGSYVYVRMELSDFDNDGMKELIVLQPQGYIDVYDVDIQFHRYQISSNTGLDAFSMKDVTGDGVDELIYGDGQWGEIHCINAVTQVQLWQITNPDHGVEGITVGDVNNDGQPEVIWSSDHIMIANVSTHAIEWTSLADRGQFNGIAIDDIDNDGTNEIVCVSMLGVLSVFNAITHKLEWQSSTTFFPNNWTGFWGCKVADIDNDGDKEIIVCTGKIYTGVIYIIDGTTKAITSFHLYTSQQYSEFYMSDVADVDNDNFVDIIVQCNDSIYVINPLTFVRKWSSHSLENTTYYRIRSLLAGNITGTTTKQILVTQQYLHILDPISNQNWKSSYKFSSATLYDFNNDGLQEIVAGNDSGRIYIINGITHQTIQTFLPIKKRIDGIKVADLNNDSIPEYIFTSEGNLYFYADSLGLLFTENYGSWDVGDCSSLRVADADSNGTYEVYFGSQVSLYELSSECYHCTWFRNLVHKQNKTCGSIDDGAISINTSGGTAPYSYYSNGNPITAQYTGLAIGTYLVNVIDNSGCSFSRTFEIEQSKLVTQISGYEIDCHNNPGEAAVGILSGTPPYSYTWSNGLSTPVISVTSSGSYSVQIIDSNNCVSNNTIVIAHDSMGLQINYNPLKCYGDKTTTAFISVINGVFPYSYHWNSGATTSNFQSLGIGNHPLTVYDSRGCQAVSLISIVEPPELQLIITSTSDDPTTSFGEGSASVTVTGGKPPYNFSWNDMFQQSSATALNLLEGTYEVKVTDNLGCTRSASIIVESSNQPKVLMYPTISSNMVYFNFQIPEQLEVQFKIVNSLGEILSYQSAVASRNDLVEIDVAKLKGGIYFINAIAGEYKYSFKLVKI